MKIPNFARLMIEDFKDLEWFPDLAQALNSPIENITKALQGGLSFEQNMASKTYNIAIDGNFPVSLKYERGKPAHVIVTRVSSGLITGQPFLIWETDGKNLKITDMVGGLPSPENKINMTILVITGE